MVRKGIHLFVALIPSFALINKTFTLILLVCGICLYTICEILTLKGVKVPLFYRIIGLANRERDKGKFALGPVTLGAGAALSILLFAPEAAFVAIYALAFGDGFASLAGRIMGRTRPAFLMGKSVEGSLACFLTVYLSALHVSHNWLFSLTVTVTATVVEALPLKDWDNIIIPLSAGYIASVFPSMLI
ncbi:MAG: phosphatidate cytidylyltransferase [Spirochaetaceae bacterium]|nr:phosphatidate cytidylyltransferase [Spirochaetaceae bacterium]